MTITEGETVASLPVGCGYEAHEPALVIAHARKLIEQVQNEMLLNDEADALWEIINLYQRVKEVKKKESSIERWLRRQTKWWFL